MTDFLDTGKAQIQQGFIRHYSYINGDPVLVILPEVKRLGASGFAVKLDDAWRWRTDNEDVRMIIHAASIACQQFQLEVTPANVHAIISVIQDGIDELLTMKPKPVEKKEKNAELLVVLNGKTFTREVTF